MKFNLRYTIFGIVVLVIVLFALGYRAYGQECSLAERIPAQRHALPQFTMGSFDALGHDFTKIDTSSLRQFETSFADFTPQSQAFTGRDGVFTFPTQS